MVAPALPDVALGAREIAALLVLPAVMASVLVDVLTAVMVVRATAMAVALAGVKIHVVIVVKKPVILRVPQDVTLHVVADVVALAQHIVLEEPVLTHKIVILFSNDFTPFTLDRTNSVMIY